MINILSIKVWIMHHYWPINKQQNSKQYKKYKWDKTFHKHGITVHIQVITIMVTVSIFVNFV